MGLGGISMWQLLIVLLIVVLIFGTKRLKSIGGDLGGAVKGFRKAMAEPEEEDDQKKLSGSEQDAQFAEEKDQNHAKQG